MILKRVPNSIVSLTMALGLLVTSQAWAGSLVRLQSSVFDPTVENSRNFDDKVAADHRLWIVSFAEPITEDLKKEITSKGFEILSFIPDQALLLRGLRGDHQFTSEEAWTPYQVAWKWDRDVRAPSKTSDNSARVLMLRTYTVKDAKSLSTKINQMQRVLALHQTGNYFIIRSYDSEFYHISQLDEVAFVQNLPEFQTLQMNLGVAGEKGPKTQPTGYETGTKVMNFESAWGLGFSGHNQVVAMGDTGLDRGDIKNIHGDFVGAVISGRNFAPFGRSWEDPMGHGTHVAGSAVGRGAQSNGLFRGGAYSAQFIVHSLWSPMLNNLMVPTKLADMFSAGLQSGAHVHTNSWGSARSFGSYDAFARQVDEFSFQNPDLLIVFAAGNSGVDMNKDGRIDSDSIGSPGTAKNVLTVGASENYELQGGIQRKVSELRDAQKIWGAEPIFSSKISDNSRGLAMFSSRGPTDDGRIKPEVVAPGTNILSARSHHDKAQDLWGRYNDDYIWSGGTSMSTPLVAGAAAVTREILQKQHKVSKPSSALLKAFLMNTSTDLFPGQYGEVGASRGQEILTRRPNSDEGFGLVDLKTISQAQNGVIVIDNRQGLATGEVFETEVQVEKDARLLVTLVWNDAPASESAGRALVNNLDLEVRGSELQFISEDTVNNFEHFEKSAKSGRYQVKVLGRQIPVGLGGRQPFALVIRTQSE